VGGKSPSMGRPRRSAAFALMSVFVMVTVLSFVTLEFARTSNVSLKMTMNYAEAKKALYFAFGGYKTALTVLKLDTNEYDGPGDYWYGTLPPIPFEDGMILVSIEDEKARFNVRELVTEYGIEDQRRRVMLERIFESLYLDSSRIDAITDWEDKDNDPQGFGGAEVYYYNVQNPSYAIRNGPILTLGELLLLKDVDREMLFLPPSALSPMVPESYEPLYEYLTVYGDGKININTAAYPVLLSLSRDMDETIVNDILERRIDDPFTSPEDLKKVESVSDLLYDEIASLITVRSDVFRITSTGSVGGLVRVVTAVVLRDSRGVRVVYFNRSL
jgi:general secretion pathway protein K